MPSMAFSMRRRPSSTGALNPASYFESCKARAADTILVQLLRLETAPEIGPQQGRPAILNRSQVASKLKLLQAPKGNAGKVPVERYLLGSFIHGNSPIETLTNIHSLDKVGIPLEGPRGRQKCF